MSVKIDIKEDKEGIEFPCLMFNNYGNYALVFKYDDGYSIQWIDGAEFTASTKHDGIGELKPLPKGSSITITNK